MAEYLRPARGGHPPGWRLVGTTADGWPLFAAPAGTPEPPGPECPWAEPGYDWAADFRASVRAVEEEGEGWRHHG